MEFNDLAPPAPCVLAVETSDVPGWLGRTRDPPGRGISGWDGEKSP